MAEGQATVLADRSGGPNTTSTLVDVPFSKEEEETTTLILLLLLLLLP
jgi:hypothetical protein